MSVWKRDGERERTSYVKEMVTSQPSMYGFLGSLAAGTVLAIPFGFGVAALPLLAYGAGTAIASMFIPSHPGYRARVDARKRAERRERARQHFEAEVEAKGRLEDPRWHTYRRMGERVASLQEIAENRRSNLSPRDIEQLEDARVNYLGMWLSLLGIEEWSQTANDRALRAKLEQVDKRLAEVKSPAERQRLMKARSDFDRALTRRSQLGARRAQIDAAMLVLADTFEEVYQNVMANPESANVAAQLQEAVERMHIEEGLGEAIDEELDDLVNKRAAAARQRAAQ